MKIRELNSWLVDSISALISSGDQTCKEALEKFNEFLNKEYGKSKQESTRFMAEELAELLEAKGYQNLIGIKEQ
jgi:chemotaxis regulatin CheY-phosphate phosphatase CheZ